MLYNVSDDNDKYRGVFHAKKGQAQLLPDIAEVVLQRGTCLRRNYGSVIVNNDEIIATGYTMHRAGENCLDMNYCIRRR